MTTNLPLDSILQGDALETLRELPSDSVHCVVTSPPYWNLRDYGTARWEGGDPACDHAAKNARNDGDFNARTQEQYGKRSTTMTTPDVIHYRDICGKCGATRQDHQLGLEPTPDEYVARMVAIFREARRVLRDDGTLWLNLGDSYASNWPCNRRSIMGAGSLANGKREARPPRMGGDLKDKDLIGIPWLVAFALRADGWYLRSDIIWCLSGGARVYARTQKGEMPMTVKDMVRLDPRTVQLWNGEKWTQVLGWGRSPRPENAIEITLRSGERVGCTPEHQWPTQRGNVMAKDLQVGDVIQTTTLPEPANPRRPHNLEDADVGWFVGMYLAEGSRSNDTIQIAGHQREVERFVRLSRIAHAFDGTCRMHKTTANGATINLYGPVLHGIIDTYVAGKIAKDKHLTMRCWQRSNAFLQSVLDGYLAGDGHYDDKNGRWRLAFTRNYALEADLRTIAARLGVQLTLNMSTVHYDGRDVPAFRGEIRFDRSNHWNVKQRGEVVALGRSRARQFWDIAVEDDPHLFALASGVLTHNCKPNPMPESVRDRPTKAHEYLFLLSKSERYYYDADAIRESATKGDAGAGARNYNWRMPAIGRIRASQTEDRRLIGRNKRTVWSVATAPYAGAHFATFPPKLIEPCILAGTSPRCCEHCGAPWARVVEKHGYDGAGRSTATYTARAYAHAQSAPRGPKRNFGEPISLTRGWRPTCRCEHNTGSARAVVLDPFGGAGTTGLVAKMHSRHYVLLELNEAYCEMARERIAKQVQPVLWSIA